jgi:glycosyltransferase involved in cell wall biosynthesis
MLGFRGIGDTLPGGIERHAAELAWRMVEKGHAVDVFCRPGYVPDPPAPYKGVTRILKPAVRTKHLEAITHTLACLPAIAFGYDIIHFHAMGPSLLSGIPRLFLRNVVATVHGLDFERAKWGRVASLALRAGAWAAGTFPDATIVVSRTLEDYYRDAMKRETVYIPNGVSEPAHRPLDLLARKFGLEPGGYFLSLGRLTPEKGVHRLIAAFQKVDTAKRLVVAGDEMLDRSYTKKLREVAGCDPRIVFSGGIYGAEKDEAFSNAFAFVLPSEVEGLSVVMLEAMSYRCPVLTSDIPENMEISRGAESEQGKPACRFFKSGDVDDLARALAGLLNDGELPAMASRARDFVLSRYGWDEMKDRTLAVYERVAGEG